MHTTDHLWGESLQKWSNVEIVSMAWRKMSTGIPESESKVKIIQFENAEKEKK